MEPPLHLLPAEIWQAALNKLSNSAKQTAINACPLFRQLLDESRVDFLFPPVWELLILRQDFHEPFPETSKQVQAYTWRKSILSFRTVSRSWCSTIDSFHQNVLSYPNDTGTNIKATESMDFVYDKTAKSLALRYSYNLSREIFSEDCRVRESPIDKFLAHFADTHQVRNPLLGRQVVFEIQCKGIRTVARGGYTIEEPCTCQPLSKITTFLSLYGHHIWNCTIVACPRPMEATDYIPLVREWLELMPNLRELSWRNNGGPDCLIHRDVVLDSAPRQLEQRPFPTLPDLKCVHLVHVPRPIVRKFLARNSQIEVYRPRQDFYWGPPGINVLQTGMPLPNLKKLSLEIKTPEHYRQLENRRNAWKLETVKLIFQSNSYFEWRQVFKVIEQWSDTLTNVVLRMPIPRTKEEALSLIQDDQLQVDLPRVKRLKLEVKQIDFIKHFMLLRELEALEIEEVSWGNLGGSLNEVIMAQTVKEDVFNSFDLKTSTIWQVYPKLRRISVGRLGDQSWKKRVYFRPTSFHENSAADDSD